jgi:uncharacterized protein
MRVENQVNLENKLRLLKTRTPASRAASELRRQLDYLQKLERHERTLPAERFPHSIEEYVEGESCSNPLGQYFLARQTLPFGRPYGKMRVGDVATSDLSALNLFLPGEALPPPSAIVFLDIETTGLAGGTGTCAFLIGLGSADGSAFEVRQFFLRELDEEKAALAALAEALEPYKAIVTFNGKSFDLPLLETRYTLARMIPPFGRLLHLDLLHPARRLWKLRLQNCELKRLERELLKVRREGDVDGGDIPQLYFDYLRTRNPLGLQPVFFHNAMDIVTLAALAAELNRALLELANDCDADGLDLFSLSRIFDRAGARHEAAAICQKALKRNLPQNLEPEALWHLAIQHKRDGRLDCAVPLWLEIAGKDTPYSPRAYEQLAIFYEHRERDPETALQYAQAAQNRTSSHPNPSSHHASLSRRVARLRRKMARQPAPRGTTT